MISETLNDQIRECYGRCVYTHKAHEKCADILHKRNACYKTWQIVLSAITSSGILAVVFTDCCCLKFITASISAIATFFTVYLKNFNPEEVAQKHGEAALELWDIRESYQSLLVDIKDDRIESGDVIQKRDILQQRLHAVFKASPRTFEKAYNKAVKALKENEEMSFSDEEINALLPKHLRK